MSSDIDGAGSSPQDWTLVNNHGHAEVQHKSDSDDSSGSSSDFVDLGEDVVRYRHVSRTSSAISIPSTTQTSPPVASTSLPANFRANSSSPVFVDQSDGSASNDQGELSCSEGDKPCNDTEYEMATRSKVSDEPALEQNQSPNKVMSSIENSASSSTATLVESQSDFSSFSNDLGNSEKILDEDIQLKGSSNSQASPREGSEENADRLPGVAFDRVSVDSIEILAMPFDEGRSQQEEAEMIVRYGDMEKEKDLVAVTQTAEEIHYRMKGSGTDCSCEESDTSEFERIEPETIREEARNQTGGEDDVENSKMDVAGARPVEELVKDETRDILTFEKEDQPQNLTEAGCHDHMNAYSHFPEPLNLSSPPLSPNMESPLTSQNTFPWQGPGVLRMIQPFPLDLLPENQAASSLASHGFPSSLHLQPPNRRGLQRQHSSSSSEEGFELLRRPRVQQEDDVASTVSSSSSDLSSSFVNVRRRRGPPVSQRHSDNDDMLDSISNFTDCSEDCLPANMMVQSQASGVKQYKHRRDDGLNTRLDWLVAMVLFAGLALGIGHFIGSTQEMVHQRSINTGQVQRLRELQDDLVTCLDRTSGIDSRIATEKTSPALQAVRLMEGLNSRMQEENLNAGRLLEQKVGPVDGDATKRSGVEDTVPKPTHTESDTSEEKPVGSPDVQSNENKKYKDVIPESQLGDDSSGELESENIKPSLDDNSGPSEADGISKIQLASDSAGISSVETQQQGEVFDASVVSNRSESNEMGGKLGEIAEEIQEDVSDNLGRLDHGSLAKKDSESNDARIFDDPTDDDQASKDVSPSESTITDPGDSAVEMLQKKLELMEEKMNQMMKTTQYWEEMRVEGQRVKNHEDREQILDSKSPNTAKDEATNEQDPLAGIASTLKSLWPDVLKTDKGKEFLQYLNHTWGSFSHSNVSRNKSLWWDVFYQELAALKTIPESDQVQAVLNNTKLLALHLQKELELVTGYLKNQSLNLVQENNITVEGLSEQVNGAWAKLKNVTSDVVDFNKDVLFSVGEQLTDTLRSVKNVSANFINEQNISMSKLGSVADQVWGTLTNYSSMVRDSVLNRTAEPAEHSKKQFHDDHDLDEESDTSTEDEFNKKSGSEPKTDASSGFGEKLKGAWDTVKNYSSNITLKQNLSISGLREQVKAAWGKVKNTSSQVLQDVSKLNLAEKVKDGAEELGKKVKSGAKELGKKVKEGARDLGKKVQEGAKTLREKVGTTFKSIKKTAERFHKTKRPCGRKKHWDRSKRHQESQKRTEKTQNKKKKKHANQQRQWEKANNFHPEKESSNHRKDGKFHKHHHNRHERHQHQTNKKHESLNDKQYLGEHYSVPSRQHHQRHLPRDTSNEHTSKDAQQQQGQTHHYSTPPTRQPLHEKSNLQSSDEHSVPQRRQIKQKMDPRSDTNGGKSVDNRKDDRKHIQKENLKEGKGCPSQKVTDPNGVGENNADSNWEDLFDCVDMHCRGDDKCMHSQRRDAARLYSELLDYEQWLQDRNLRKDVRELREFLEELGEFLSETNSDDRDLDELKDEFGEMVQDMEDGARKRYKKQNKLFKSRSQESLKSHHADATHKRQNTKSGNVQDKAETENSTVIIDLESLPQHGDPKPEQGQFSSKESHHSSESTERRKFAGRGFQSTDDDGDWYLQRARDREDQRGSNNWPKSGKFRETSNWYMHWVQGRINGRTGVTVWDMYEWIRERYMFREELRSHEMEDHVNWFLRKP